MHSYIIRQEDKSDCGACCLYSIIKYYNGFVPLEVIKYDTLTSKDGTNFYYLKEAAKNYGFEAKAYQSKDLKSIDTPSIVQLKIDNFYHFVVIYKICNDTITVMDPDSGIMKYNKDKFLDIFTGNILVLKPINRIVNYKKNNDFIKSILKIISNNKYYLIGLLLISILVVLISLFNVSFIRILFSSFSINLLIIFILLIVFKNILNFIKVFLLTRLNKNFNLYLIPNYIKKCFSLPFKYLQLKSSGEIITRVNDLRDIKEFITREFTNIVLSFLFVIVSLIIIFSINVNLGFIIVIMSIVYGLLVAFKTNKLDGNFRSLIDDSTNFNSKVIEYFNKLEIIMNLNKEKYFYEKLKNNNEKYANSNYNLEKKLYHFSNLKTYFYDVMFVFIIMYYICYSLAVDDLLIFIMYYNYYFENLTYIINLFANYGYFKDIFRRINGVYYLNNREYKYKRFNFNSISIRNLHKSIGNTTIFTNYSTDISSNDKVLVMGSNGAGKSTLLNMICGNIDDYEGNINIGNTSIKNIAPSYLKKHITYVKQNDDLFNDSIINNIVMDGKFIERKFNVISEMLYLDKIVLKKNYIYDSDVINNLSGGEKQRIILARALYQNFDILLLDEALSEISSDMRNKIIFNINNHFKNKIIIYVSHNKESYNYSKIIDLSARKDYKC